MERILAILTDKQQAFVGTVLFAGVAAPGTSLAGVVGIHFDRHRPRQRGFIGNDTVQFRKGPRSVTPIRTTLFRCQWKELLAFPSLCTAGGVFTNVCQVLQANEGMRVPFYKVFRDGMIRVQLQPSL